MSSRIIVCIFRRIPSTKQAQLQVKNFPAIGQDLQVFACARVGEVQESTEIHTSLSGKLGGNLVIRDLTRPQTTPIPHCQLLIPTTSHRPPDRSIHSRSRHRRYTISYISASTTHSSSLHTSHAKLGRQLFFSRRRPALLHYTLLHTQPDCTTAMR